MDSVQLPVCIQLYRTLSDQDKQDMKSIRMHVGSPNDAGYKHDGSLYTYKSYGLNHFLTSVFQKGI